MSEIFSLIHPSKKQAVWLFSEQALEEVSREHIDLSDALPELQSLKDAGKKREVCLFKQLNVLRPSIFYLFLFFQFDSFFSQLLFFI